MTVRNTCPKADTVYMKRKSNTKLCCQIPPTYTFSCACYSYAKCILKRD